MKCNQRALSVLGLVCSGLASVAISTAQASEEGMAAMPTIAAKKSYPVPTTEAGETLLEQRGFGDEEPEVRMMNLMMVEGSGMEGMDMGAMNIDAKKMAAGGSPKHGDARIASPSTVSSKADTSYVVVSQLAQSPAKVGSNILQIRVTELRSKHPAAHLRLRVKVAMTSMDMGTEEPTIKEISPGYYSTKVAFSMQGPWAVTVILPGGEQNVFNFNAVKSGQK